MLSKWDLSVRSTAGISHSICFIIEICILFLSLYLLLLILWRRHLIDASFSMENANRYFQSSYIRKYCIWSVVLATIGIISKPSYYLICVHQNCDDNAFYIPYNILKSDTYLLAQLFLHLVFIGRLFNPHHRMIYGEMKYIQYVLGLLIFALILNFIVYNIAIIASPFNSDLSNRISIICSYVYMGTDITLSLMTTILFFRPIGTRQRIKPLIQQNSAENLSVYSLWNASMKRYSILSAVQLITTIICDATTVVCKLMYNGKINISGNGLHIFADIQSVFATFDLFMLILCIYIGFLHRETVCIPRKRMFHFTQSTEIAAVFDGLMLIMCICIGFVRSQLVPFSCHDICERVRSICNIPGCCCTMDEDDQSFMFLFEMEREKQSEERQRMNGNSNLDVIPHSNESVKNTDTITPLEETKIEE